jgi:hypothetical protein
MALSRHRDGRQGKSARHSRRRNNELRRQLRRIATSGQQAYATLLAVLAQKGGEVTVTKGTIDQVTENYKRLGFVVENSKEHDNEFIVRLTEAPDPEAYVPEAPLEDSEEDPRTLDEIVGVENVEPVEQV